MRAIHYAGEDLLTGTAIANAVVHYAQALAGSGASDTVEIPVIGGSGRVVPSSFLLGPASQLIAVEVPEFAGDEIIDDELTARLDRLSEALMHPIASPIPSDQMIENFDELL